MRTSGRRKGASGRRCTPHVVGRNDRHAKPARQFSQCRVFTFLIAQEMTLHLDVDVPAAKQAHESIEQATDAMLPCIEHRSTGERDEAGCEAVELFEGERPFSLRGAQLHARHEATEILIALC